MARATHAEITAAAADLVAQVRTGGSAEHEGGMISSRTIGSRFRSMPRERITHLRCRLSLGLLQRIRSFEHFW